MVIIPGFLTNMISLRFASFSKKFSYSVHLQQIQKKCLSDITFFIQYANGRISFQFLSLATLNQKHKHLKNIFILLVLINLKF